MAKSKNGGTRAMIRGRVGADVYSVGKDGKGNRQQVVRSLAEQVANPRTSAQMAGRCIMSTCMQAVSALAFLVDHSFDGMSTGQPSISEFIRTNYQLLKAAAAANPAGTQADPRSFGFSKYQEKGCRAGAYVISKGNAQLPTTMTYSLEQVRPSITIVAATYGDLKEKWGLTPEEYITIVGMADNKEIKFARLAIKEGLADATVITEQNLLDAFNVDTNAEVSVDVDDSIILSLNSDAAQAGGIIVSRKENGVYVHNNCTLYADGENLDYGFSDALQTYPQGSERFLNGGDI